MLALGGYGATNRTGEILLIDPHTGAVIKALEGHRQTVCSLAFAPDGGWLVSIDRAGETRLWKPADWTSHQVFADDAQTYHGVRAARLSAQQSAFSRPVVALGSQAFAMPILVQATAKTIEWKLQVLRPNDLMQTTVLDAIHRESVTALAATPDGAWMASADGLGKLFLWQVATKRAVQIPVDSVVKSLAFSPDGQKLVIGSVARGDQSSLQVWDTRANKPLFKRALHDHVYASAVSPDGQRLAYVGGQRHEIFVERLDAETPVPLIDRRIELGGEARKVLKVAFREGGAPYQVALGFDARMKPLFNDYAEFQSVFDTRQLRLRKQGKGDRWTSPAAQSGGWRAVIAGHDVRLFNAKNVAQGTISLDPNFQGKPRCYCWLPAKNQVPAALAVGTDRQNGIYVFSLGKGFPLWRQFRGHEDWVTSVAASGDGRLLASASADGTVKFWSLSDLSQGARRAGRWGAEFEAVEGGLVASSVNEAGPVYRRGIRRTTQIHTMLWRDADGTPHQSERPDEMLDRLEKLPWHTPIEFRYAGRAGRTQAFELLPAWQAIGTLLVSRQGEWALWTPEGYYDASLNGNTLFGWQVNRGLRAAPRYYRADQFQKKLERPEIISRLLMAGTLDEAFRQVERTVPAEADNALQTQIAAAPHLEIVSPSRGFVSEGPTLRACATVELPSAVELRAAKIYTNGVFGGHGTLIDKKQDTQGNKTLTYEWPLELTCEPKQLIQVFVSTDVNVSDLKDVEIAASAVKALNKRLPKLHIMSLAVGDYHGTVDGETISLNYPVADAKAVLASLQSQARGLYDIQPALVFCDSELTPEKLRAELTAWSARLNQDARPDDLLVIFLAGHGIVIDRKYHFLCANVDPLVLSPDSLISWSDFDPLMDARCRKIVLLDTCHSGAFHQSRSDPKLGIREFQENSILTLAAARDGEEALENSAWGHGAFTKCLLEAFEGRADDSADRVVTFDEVVTYVGQAVPKLVAEAQLEIAARDPSTSEGNTRSQEPIAAPRELLPYVRSPLSKARAVP